MAHMSSPSTALGSVASATVMAPVVSSTAPKNATVTSYTLTKPFVPSDWHGLKVEVVFTLSTGDPFKTNIATSIEKHLADTYSQHGAYSPTAAPINTVCCCTQDVFMAAFAEFSEALAAYIKKQANFWNCNPSSIGVVKTKFGVCFTTDTDWKESHKYFHCFPTNGDPAKTATISTQAFDLDAAEFNEFVCMKHFVASNGSASKSSAEQNADYLRAKKAYEKNAKELWCMKLVTDKERAELDRLLPAMPARILKAREDESRDRSATQSATAEARKKKEDRDAKTKQFEQGLQESDEAIGFSLFDSQ